MWPVLAVVKISAGKVLANLTFLEQKGLQYTGEDAMGVGAGRGAVLVGTVADNDMGLDGALGDVVVGGEPRDIQEGEEAIVMSEQPRAESLPGFVGVNVRGKMEETVFDASCSSSKDKEGQSVPPVHQALGVGQQAFELFFGVSEVGGRVVPPGFPNVTAEVDEALLLEAAHFGVIGTVKIADEHPGKRFPQYADWDLAAAAFVHANIGPVVVDESPEPMGDAVDGPTGFVHMLDGGGLDGL